VGKSECNEVTKPKNKVVMITITQFNIYCSKLKIEHLFYLIFLLICGCRESSKFLYVEIQDTKVKNIVKDYQKQHIPNNDKIILIELFRKIHENHVLFLSTLNHPNELNEYEKYFISNYDGIVIFFNVPGSSYFNFKLNSDEVAKSIREKYGHIDINEEYEVDMSSEGLNGGWYITRDDFASYKVFNMTDSIRLYHNVDCQYKKLEKFIDPFCESCECVDK